MMRTNRRQFLRQIGIVAGGTAAAGLTLGKSAGSAVAQSRADASSGAGSDDTAFSLADLRGTANANELGLRPGAIDDQSRLLQAILDKAASEDKPVFLPPGNYLVSNILLPARTRLMGVPGASRLVYSGSGHFFIAENADHVELTGLVFDGANRTLHDYAEAAVKLSNCAHAVVDNCLIQGSTLTGLRVDRSKGRIERSRITGAFGSCGIYALENRGMAIRDNVVSDCLNGGILVHRWSPGEDGTIVSGNRIERIGAANGGTGQWGNGINVYQANNVTIANNQVSDCAFSAIRSNGGSGVQMLGNTCLRSGETAVYSEFVFEGAIVANNLVDGGARGISIANFQQGGRLAVVQGNIVRNITATPPYEEDDFLWRNAISAEADTAITGNVIENAEFGMILGWGPYVRDVVVTGNIVRRADTGIAVTVVDGSGSTHIADNTFAEMVRGSIIGYRWRDVATDDLVQNGADRYPHLTIERNRTA